MKQTIIITLLLLTISVLDTRAQVKLYRTSGGEIIFSGADVRTTPSPQDLSVVPDKVNTNVRFTLFLHIQQFVNLDFNSKIGLFSGAALRNVGLITEDYYQRVGFAHVDATHPHWNKNTKLKRRSYSLGFPLGVKIGALDKHYFVYAGAEYEWMFHYKQKLFLDGEKFKESEWGSERVNPWIPSFFAGVQFPGGLNLKFKYYLKDFLNTDYKGVDFGEFPDYAEQVDYSQFKSSGVWYISLAFIINRQQFEKMMERQPFPKSAYHRY